MTEEEFWKILHDVPEPKPIFHRLYYNDDGTPVCYSMEELPHKYIELTVDQYNKSPPNIRVVNGKIVEIKPPIVYRKLVPSIIDGTPCSPDNICIVVDNSTEHIKWKMSAHEIERE